MADVIEPQQRAIVSREEATALGLKRFYTGVPCRQGHDAERYVHGKTPCVVCKDKWYATNREQVLAKQRQFRIDNLEIVREQDRLARIKNIETRRRRRK